MAREHWWKDKQAHAKRVQSAIVAKAEAKRVEDALRDATARQNKTLEATSLVREKALKLLVTAKSAKEVNAIASALYRINEIERGLLNYDIFVVTLPRFVGSAVSDCRNSETSEFIRIVKRLR